MLTAGVWTHFKNRMSIAQFELSDVISFHTYLEPDAVDGQIEICRQFKRPVICTEWLMRQPGKAYPDESSQGRMALVQEPLSWGNDHRRAHFPVRLLEFSPK